MITINSKFVNTQTYLLKFFMLSKLYNQKVLILFKQHLCYLMDF